MSWQRVLGIVGGLGPHAHVEFERRLLALVEAGCDQDYPPWLLSSLPATPDRTAAVLGRGPSPAPELRKSLERLAPSADFAVIACVTAHVFLDEVGPPPLPILDVVEATLEEAAARAPGTGVGVLATTGALLSRLFQRTATRLASPPEIVTLLDLDGGERLQELVMTAIYDGLKTGAARDPRTGVEYRELLVRAAAQLAEAGARVTVAGCTEIGMALSGDVAGTEIVDPLDVAARRALETSRGERPLPVHPKG